MSKARKVWRKSYILNISYRGAVFGGAKGLVNWPRGSGVFDETRQLHQLFPAHPDGSGDARWRARSSSIEVGPDQTLETRLLLTAPVQPGSDQSVDVRFHVVDRATGESAVTRDH
ncbi:MAG: hypothetical protein P4M15_10940, partial [Alphaproteobacteria bacterium]|nr:hypothetical protein [Alphaproteobacteria bacterium]